AGRQLTSDLLAFRRLQVQGDAALVAVRAEVIGADTVPVWWEAAGVIAAARRLDFNHVRAEVAQRHRGERPGEVAAQVEDANAVRASLRSAVSAAAVTCSMWCSLLARAPSSIATQILPFVWRSESGDSFINSAATSWAAASGSSAMRVARPHWRASSASTQRAVRSISCE